MMIRDDGITTSSDNAITTSHHWLSNGTRMLSLPHTLSYQTENRCALLHLNSREKWRKCISVTGSLRGQAQVRPVDKLDEACTKADDWMMLVQHCSADRVMS